MKAFFECTLGAVLCIPMICAVLYWLVEDVVRGRRLGCMEV